MAYAAGLGTFGLCDGLITARGKAMRTGSVVARLEIDASPRPYDDHMPIVPSILGILGNLVHFRHFFVLL
jgi:hypothetical protein